MGLCTVDLRTRRTWGSADTVDLGTRGYTVVAVAEREEYRPVQAVLDHLLPYPSEQSKRERRHARRWSKQSYPVLGHG